MRYTKFEIKNFRGIKKLTLDFTEAKKFNIFSLVGLNESGKTTILEAMDFFQKDIPLAERHDLIPKDRYANFNDSISVIATLELTNDDELAIKKYAASVGFNIEKDIEKFSIEKKYDFKNSEPIENENEYDWSINMIGKKKKGRKVISLDGEDERWEKIIDFIEEKLVPPIIYYPNFLITFPERIYLQEGGEGDKEGQRLYREVIQDILDSLNDDLNIGEHIIRRMESSSKASKESLDSVMSKMGEKIADVILKSWDKIFGQGEQRASRRQIIINPGVEGEEGDRKHYLEIRLGVGAEKYQIRELCLGFKWFFAFLLFIEFRKYRAKEKGEILFLIDEPASNLHSTAQGKLLERFQEIISKGKLIYATHSHYLIKSEWLEGAFIVRNKALNYEVVNYDSSKTDIEAIPYRQFVARYPNQETYFKPILDSLDYRPSNLELVPDIVIVEGKNDFYTFKYINEVIFGNEPSSLRFYPGNGAGNNGQVIRLYTSWVRNFVVFMDGDGAGKRAKKKYNNEIGDIINNKVFMLSDISKSWKGFSTENLFTEAEKMKIIKAIEPDAKRISKLKFNRAMQNLLFLKHPIVLNKITRAKFERIFKFLKEALKSEKVK